MTSDVLVIIGVGGMGLAIARRLGAGGITVLADFDRAQLDLAAAELAGDGHNVTTTEVDVSDRGSVAALADYAQTQGRVASLVHTAGLSPEQASRDRVLAVDLLGVALVLD